MKPLPLHAVAHQPDVLTDHRGRYGAFRVEDRWQVYALDRSGIPTRLLACVESAADAQLVAGLDRGPLSGAQKVGLLMLVLAMWGFMWAAATAPVLLFQVIVALLALGALIALAGFALAMWVLAPSLRQGWSITHF